LKDFFVRAALNRAGPEKVNRLLYGGLRSRDFGMSAMGRKQTYRRISAILGPGRLLTAEAVWKEQYLFTNRRCQKIQAPFYVTEWDRRSDIEILNPVVSKYFVAAAWFNAL